MGEPIHDAEGVAGAGGGDEVGMLGDEVKGHTLIGVGPGPVADEKAIFDAGEVAPEHGVEGRGHGERIRGLDTLAGEFGWKTFCARAWATKDQPR